MLQIRKIAEKLLLGKLKAQVLEEEKAARVVKRGPRAVGKLQHAAITAITQKGKRSGHKAGAGKDLIGEGSKEQVSNLQ